MQGESHPELIRAEAGVKLRYNRQTGITRATLDATVKRQLRDAYEAVNGGACTFVFCPGPDTYHSVPMATCSKCHAAILLRRALKRLEILPS